MTKGGRISTVLGLARMGGSERSKRMLHQVRSLVVGVAVVACGDGAPAAESPQPSELYPFHVLKWTIAEQESGDVRLDWCRAYRLSDDPYGVVFEASPGEVLVSTVLEEKGARTVWTDRDDYGCDSEGDLWRAPTATTANPECWEFVEPSPVRVLSLEIIPSEPPERDPGFEPEWVLGRGRRMVFEVLDTGNFDWAPSGLCDVEPRREFSILSL